MGNKNSSRCMQPYLSPIAVWALAVGSAIGWGSLIVTNSSYLSQSGYLGSILGLLVGLAMMFMVASHYHFLANRYPGTGGLYNYIKYVFGYDRAFLAAWFLFLIYIAIFWANATSIPLFARYFLRSIFSFGYMYTVFGYEVYIGEILVTLVVIGAVGLLCILSKKLTAHIMVILALIFTIGITVCFAIAMFGHKSTDFSFDPAFVPDKSTFRQVTHIAFISPWAFIGFESVSHSAAEYRFKHKNLFGIMAIALIVITALYIFVMMLSITAYPEECSSWLDYISRLDEFEGIKGLPAFYAANHYLGKTGVYILMASLLSLVITSLIGMLRALSRLCYAVAQDNVLPKKFSKLNSKQIPVNAILLVLAVSLPIPFLGRTPIGWIVDTTTIGATIIYGFVSVAVFREARKEKAKLNIFISGICLVILVIFLSILLFPELFSDYTIGTETYALMTVWTLLGLIFFNRVIRKDHARNFGKAIIVWIALLAFIIIMSMAWVERINESKESAVIDNIFSYYSEDAESNVELIKDEEFINEQREALRNADKYRVIIILALFTTAIGVLVVNYRSMRKWEKKATEERDQARIIAYTDPMTGVKSKTAFVEQENLIDQKIKNGTVEDFSIIVCDVNGLKKINDTLGHKAGDEYICAACHMLCEYFKHSPVFRIGGDEFVVIVEGPDFDMRDCIMEHINSEIENNVGTSNVVASLGICDYEKENCESIHDVFRRADERMYERKNELKSLGAVTRD